MTNRHKVKLSLNIKRQSILIISIVLYVILKELYLIYGYESAFWNNLYYLNDIIFKLTLSYIAYKTIISKDYKSIVGCVLNFHIIETITVLCEITNILTSPEIHGKINATGLFICLLKLLYDVKRTSKN